ncbi:MAG: hypothetical protein WCL43_08910 [Chlorobium sp.]
MKKKKANYNFLPMLFFVPAFGYLDNANADTVNRKIRIIRNA